MRQLIIGFLILLVACSNTNLPDKDMTTVNPKYPAKCDLLSGNDKRDCYSIVAELKKDYSICDALDEKISASCYLAAYEAIGDPKNCERFTDNIHAKSACYQELAIIALDPTLCSKGQIKDGCYLKVAIGLADKSVCENIKDEKEKKICYAVIDGDVVSCKELGCIKDLALFKNDVAICGEKYEDCLIRFPVTEELCDSFVSGQSKDRCFFKLAESTKNTEFCSRIEFRNSAGFGDYPGTSKEDCYAYMAVKLKDSSLCEKADWLKEECLWKVDIVS